MSGELMAAGVGCVDKNFNPGYNFQTITANWLEAVTKILR